MRFVASCNGFIEAVDHENAVRIGSALKDRTECSVYVWGSLIVISGDVDYDRKIWMDNLNKEIDHIIEGKITFSGEDDSKWRFVIKNGSLCVEVGHITWEKASQN